MEKMFDFLARYKFPEKKSQLIKRDVLLCADDNLLIYDTTLSNKEIESWAKIADLDPHDVFPVTLEELQFYVIDERMQMSETKDEDVRELLKRNK